MGALAVSALITPVRRVLLDPAPGVTWLDAALLALFNEGERAICGLKTEAYAIVGPIAMVAGTHQQLPAGGTGILDVYENTIGLKRRITMVPRSLHDASARFWPAATPEQGVQEWTADPRDPTRFQVSPPNDGTGIVLGLYGAVPPAIASVAGTINLSDTYEKALKSYVLAQCYAENTARQDLAKSGFYETDWKTLIGIRTQSQVAASQKSGKPGGD